MNYKKVIVKYAHLMYEQGYSVASEGNISLRKSDNLFYITPSNLVKNFLSKSDIITIDQAGQQLKGKLKPSSERFTHLEIYQQRPDVKAVVHAHPFYTILLNSLGIDPFKQPFLAEAVMFLRNVLTSGFALPSTKDGAAKICKICQQTNIIILDRHGTLTYGPDLPTAFSLLEILEKYAALYYHAFLAKKKVRSLNKQQIAELNKVVY
jgi:L-fuculose-phosphate aldolase